jgi:hypothetical protein
MPGQAPRERHDPSREEPHGTLTAAPGSPDEEPVARAAYVARGNPQSPVAVGVRTEPALKWHQSPGVVKNLSFYVTLTVPLFLLGVLTQAFGVTLLPALLVSGLVYAGLYLMLNWRTRRENEIDAICDEVGTYANQCRQHILQIEALATHARSDIGRDRFGKLAALAAAALSRWENAGGNDLSAVAKLECLLSQSTRIFVWYVQITNDEGVPSEQSRDAIGRIEHDLLDLIESSLVEMSKSFKREDAVNLDVAIRVLDSMLITEGRSEKS